MSPSPPAQAGGLLGANPATAQGPLNLHLSNKHLAVRGLLLEMRRSGAVSQPSWCLSPRTVLWGRLRKQGLEAPHPATTVLLLPQDTLPPPCPLNGAWSLGQPREGKSVEGFTDWKT